MQNKENEIEKTKIYLITNINNNLNEVYIGKTKTSRKYDHISKFGPQITYTYIDEINSLDKKDWEPLETYWIEQFKAWGFKLHNIKNKGGSGPSFQTQETRNKISLSLIGKTKGQISKETKDKISKSNKGRPKPINFLDCTKRKILQYDLEGNFIKEWESITYAREILKICNINGVCVRDYKQAGGFIFRYVEEPLERDFKQSPHGNLNKKRPKSAIDSVIKAKSIPILQYDLEGNFIKSYESIGLANKLLNIKQKKIRLNLCGKLEHVNGFIFKLKN